MNVIWYYAVAGKVSGPVEWAVLRDAVKSGAVGQDDLVWTPGYGSEWKKASVLGLVAPPPTEENPSAEAGAADVKSGPDAGNAAGPDAGTAADGTDEDDVEKSVFMPEDQDCSDIAPNPNPSVVHAFFAGSNSVWSLLTSPFSFRRWLSFSIAVLMIAFGALFGTFSFSAVADVFNGPAHGKIIERLELTDVARSDLWTFRKRWNAELADMASRKTPDDSVMMKMADDAVASVRDVSKRVAAWWRGGDPSLRGGVIAGVALMLLLSAYIRSWLIARGRMLAMAHIYRRDAILLLSWDATRRPSAVLAGALFVLNALFSAANAAILRHGLKTFAFDASADSGTLLGFAFAFAAVAVVRAVAVSFTLDFVSPRVLLEKTDFGTACARALKSLGGWFVRYMLLLEVYTFACELLLAPLARSLVFFTLVSMPFVMLRVMWALMIVFEIDPSLCKLLPPLPECFAKRRKDGGKKE